MDQSITRRRPRSRSGLVALVGGAIVAALSLAAPARAKVFVYTLTTDGTLVKYDPETDRVTLTPGAGRGHINPRLEDAGGLETQTRILDMARKRIVTDTLSVEGGILIDLAAGRAVELVLGPPHSVKQIEQFIYPRKASRFYVQWIRVGPSSAPLDVVWTAVGLDGKVLGSGPSMLRSLMWPVYHPDGRQFYVDDGDHLMKLVDGETLNVVATYDMVPVRRPSATVPAVVDVRDGRALLVESEKTPSGSERVLLFTTDLTFSAQSASVRIATGLEDIHRAYVLPGGRAVIVQEPRTPTVAEGAGRLHVYDVASGTKLGVIEFPAPSGAELLGFHPDGRRLFIRMQEVVKVGDTFTTKTRLVIVDVTTRAVLRTRPFEAIGVAADFVDEPQ